MVRLVKCDKCGTVTDDENGFYCVNRYTDSTNEEAELCPECLPNEIEEVLRSVEF